MILVTGARGNIGRQLIRELRQRDLPLRLLMRDPAQAADAADGKTEVAIGDYESPESLDAALRGVDKAFLLPASSLRQVRHETNFIEAARRAGLKHVVKLSVLGADPKSPGAITQWHGMAERRLEASGIPFTHLRPNLFMQNLLWFAESIAASGAFNLPLLDSRVALIDTRDVAAAAAIVLTEDGHGGKSYSLTGPAALDFHEVAEEISRVIGREIRYVGITDLEFAQSVVSWGHAGPYVDAVLSIWRSIGGGGYIAVTRDFETITGRPPNDLAKFVHDYAATFRNGARGPA